VAGTPELGYLCPAVLVSKESPRPRFGPVLAVLLITSPWHQPLVFVTVNTSDFSFNFVHMEEGGTFKHFMGFKNYVSYTK